MDYYVVSLSSIRQDALFGCLDGYLNSYSKVSKGTTESEFILNFFYLFTYRQVFFIDLCTFAANYRLNVKRA